MANRATRSDFYRSTTTQLPSQTKPKVYVSHLHVDPTHSGYDAADYHQQQRTHYGADRMDHQRPQHEGNTFPQPQPAPRPPPRTCDRDQAAANEKATRRKPVPPPPSSSSSSYDPKVGPYPPSHKRTVSAEAIGLKAPQMPREPVAPGASKYINTRADGRFDPRTIHPGETEEKVRMPPSSFGPGEAKPGASRGASSRGPPPSSFGGAVPRVPSTTLDDMPQSAVPPPHAETTNTTTPPASSSDDRPPLHRTSSTRSLRDGFKSLGERLRRGSAEFMHNLSRATSLASKHPKDRTMYEAAKADEKRASAAKKSEERESSCQEDPELRPAWETEQLRRKNFARFERERAQGRRGSRERNPHAYDPDKSQQMADAERRARAEQRNAPYTKAQREQHDTDSDSTPSGRTSPTPSFRSSISLSPSERFTSREEHGQPHRPVSPALDKWDKLGMALGAMVDPVVPGRRKRSDQSDFFGDAAPGGAMDRCDLCGEEPGAGALKYGLCGRCEYELRSQGARKR